MTAAIATKYAPKSGYQPRGVATTTIMNASRARIFRCAGARCTAEWPWKCSLWPCPAPISGLVVLGPAPAHGVRDPAGQGQHEDDAEDPGHAAVPAEDGAVRLAGVREPVVLGDLRQAVGVVVREPARHAGQDERDGEDAEDEPAGPHATAFGLISSSLLASTRRAPCTRSGRTAMIAPTARNVMTPS